jgi:hypothetical protein
MNFDPKNRQHVLMALAGGAVVFYIALQLVLTPLWNSFWARNARLADLRKKVNAGEVLVQRESSLVSRWSDMTNNSLSIQSSTAQSQLSRAFDKWTQSSGVSMTSYRPQWKRAGDDYMTLECQTDIAGNIGDISRFLYELGRDPLGVKVDSAEISTRDTDGARINLKLTVSGLQLLSPTR